MARNFRYTAPRKARRRVPCSKRARATAATRARFALGRPGHLAAPNPPPVPAASTPFTSEVTLNRSSGSTLWPVHRRRERPHKLMVAGAIKRGFRHQSHFRRQLHALECLRHLASIGRFRLIRQARNSGRDRLKPRARGRHTARNFLDGGDRFRSRGPRGCFQYHSKTQLPTPRLGWQSLKRLGSCCDPARCRRLSSPNCTACLSALIMSSP
jgi:hypothetical protein